MISKNRNFLLSGICLLLAMSCEQRHFQSEAELLEYIQDIENGYTQHKSVNGVDYALTYRPTDLLVWQEVENVADTKRTQALRSKYRNFMYFILSMSINNQELLSASPKDKNEFGKMVSQLAFGMNEKVHMYTQSKDTVELADYNYPRMYGMSGATTIMFVYPRDNNALKGKYINFTIEDLGMYTGEVKFKIPLKKLMNEPELRI